MLRCSSGGASVERDARADVRFMPVSGLSRAVRMPSADLVAVVVRRGDDGVVCVSYRLAALVRLGSELALQTRRQPTGGAAAQGADEQRYEVQLPPDGKVHVSRRAHGLPPLRVGPPHR